MTANRDDRLEDLISKAAERISAAAGAMERANRELVELLEIRASRPWSADEFSRYLALSRRERAAHRQYLAGRHWFDNVRHTRANTPAGVPPDVDPPRLGAARQAVPNGPSPA